MKKKISALTLIAGMLLLNLSCSQEDDTAQDVLDLEKLTGSTSKQWQMVKITPNDDQEHASCQVDHPRNLDNYHTFWADGRFEHDNGEVHEDKNCNQAGCCSDAVDLKGYWEVKPGTDTLIVTFDQRRDYSSEEFTSIPTIQTFWRVALTSLTDQRFVIQTTDPEDNITYTAEFINR
ncbi:hypothetical protein [Tunicatimonas pelagia]|uniref:hypothetical protein n=1 Tax=Tunicatimonas pelagia TaxID=931531 RepID=UPI0026668586|nr:hypothetical protein [Tunicatimonas pelagia]WKN44231.1 hypothetical protein P0M28_04530 [Tunicatimonas pelagia]